MKIGRFESTGMPEPATRGSVATLPQELENRIGALETTDSGEDFDAIAWCWMIFLGLVGPAALLLVGWWL